MVPEITAPAKFERWVWRPAECPAGNLTTKETGPVFGSPSIAVIIGPLSPAGEIAFHSMFENSVCAGLGVWEGVWEVAVSAGASVASGVWVVVAQPVKTIAIVSVAVLNCIDIPLVVSGAYY